jgi:hypothetical protein
MRIVLLTYLILTLIVSAGGAVLLIMNPTGAHIGLHELWLNQTAFASFVVPGLLILGLITVPVVMWLFLTIRKNPMAIPALKLQGILTAIALLFPLYLLHKITIWLIIPIVFTAVGFWIAGKLMENELSE